MKLRLITFCIIITLFSCKKEVAQLRIPNKINEVNLDKNFERVKFDSAENECDKFWKLRNPKDSIKIGYINELIYKNHNIPEVNKNFLHQLQLELKMPKKDRVKILKIEQSLFPVFKLEKNKIGVFSFPIINFDNSFYEDISIESELIKKHTNFYKSDNENFAKLIHYQNILDSIYPNNKPLIYLYSKNNIRKSQVISFGIYLDACLEYYHYSINESDIKINDDMLIGSRFKLELVYIENAKIDSLVKMHIKKECFDCPNSLDFQKTFARLKGFNNLFFMYADTFPLNNKLDTPSRSLIMKTEEDTIVYLWYEEVDLFGCSCL